jgi:kinesin family protein 18/19
LNALLPVLRKQYWKLKETGLSNAAFDSDFKDIEHLVERKKVVAWADQTNEHSNRNDLPGISLLMTFPQLEPIQSISCCKYFYFIP